MSKKNNNNNNRINNYELNDDVIDNITSTVLKFIQPSTKDSKKVKLIEKKIIDEIKNYKIPQIIDVQTGGSFAKDTNLKKDMDIDIFILIDTNVNEVDFERIALDVGFKVLKNYAPITRYSEHPYVEGVVKIDKKKEQIRLNIVPCYNVEKGKWKSAADRSQYHTTYMQKMLKPYQKNQIRILKAFLKGIGVYGAELSTSGFSGYVTEVLVLKYGNFKNVIKFIASITRENEIITIDNNYDDEVIIKKFQSPIIIIDPIDPNRNLGKAISPESLSRFIYSTRAFLKNPSLNFFKIERESNPKNKDNLLADIDKLLPNILILEFNFSLRSPDIIWGQLKKLTKSITRLFDDNEFTTIKSDCYIYDKNYARLVFLLKSTIISPLFEKKGPSVFMANEVFQFVNKNTDKKNLSVLWITEEMKVTCLNDRKIIDAIKFLEHEIKKEKCNSIGIPRGLIDDLGRDFKIYTLNKNRIKNKDKQKLVLDFLFKDMKLFGSRY